MRIRLDLLFLSLCLSLTLAAQPVQADLVLNYDVQFVDDMGNDLAGPVSAGTKVFWNINAVISGSPNSGSNFGIAVLSVGLEDSFGETLSQGTSDLPLTAMTPKREAPSLEPSSSSSECSRTSRVPKQWATETIRARFCWPLVPTQ